MRSSCCLLLAVPTLLLGAACGDDSSAASSSAGGGGGGTSTSEAATTSASSSTSASSTSASSGSASSTASGSSSSGGTGGGGGQGGDGQGGGSGGAGTGGGQAACPAIPFAEGLPLECDGAGPLALAYADTTLCTADSGVIWPAKIFTVEVDVGECLHMRADNVGSPDGADLFGAIIDPSGKSLLFDDELDCTVPNPDGYECPEGGITVETAGVAYIVVGAWEGDGCPAPGETPYELTVSIDSLDVDLTDAELCAGDLLEIIP